MCYVYHMCIYIYIYIFIHIYIYIYTQLFTLLDVRVSSLRRGHANLLCIVPILTDDARRESRRIDAYGTEVTNQRRYQRYRTWLYLADFISRCAHAGTRTCAGAQLFLPPWILKHRHLPSGAWFVPRCVPCLTVPCRAVPLFDRSLGHP